MRLRFLGLLLLTLAIAPQAQGFGTINGMGQHSEHQRITRAALNDFGPRTLNEIAGVDGRFGGVGAPDNPLRGLVFTSASHCDNGDYLAVPGYPRTQADAQATLQTCRAWMKTWLDGAVTDAAPLAHGSADASLDCHFVGVDARAKCRVLADLGVALHAAQDFYSHTNWVDRPADAPISADNPPGLGHEGRAPWIDPRMNAPFPAGLMSGCFQYPPESWFCNYSNTRRAKHAVLNKDEGPIGATGAEGHGLTPRGAVNGNFERAVAAAIEDTRDKWGYFQEQVRAVYGEAEGRRIACIVRSDDPARC